MVLFYKATEWAASNWASIRCSVTIPIRMDKGIPWSQMNYPTTTIKEQTSRVRVCNLTVFDIVVKVLVLPVSLVLIVIIQWSPASAAPTDLHAFDPRWILLRVSSLVLQPSLPTIIFSSCNNRMGLSAFSFRLADTTRVIMDGSVAGPPAKGLQFPQLET